MRHVLFLTALGLAGLPAVAHAQLPPLPEPPAVTVPTLPLPLPPAPEPTPLPPAPGPTPLPPIPEPTPLPPPPTTQTTTPTPLPEAPSPVSAPTPTAPGSSVPSTGAASPSSARPRGGSQGSQQGVRPRRTVTFRFRVAAAGRIEIPLTQVAPVCRPAGRLLFEAEPGLNRFRFDGRPGRDALRDGTYVAETPSSRVRFAIVRGEPTRRPDTFAASVCPPPGSGHHDRSSLVAALDAARTPPAVPAPDADETAEEAGFPRVLGTSLTEAAQAAVSLHPAFYLLLALAIAALAAATLPSRALPVSAAGAALARRRGELTLGGTLALLTVLVAYWVTLL